MSFQSVNDVFPILDALENSSSLKDAQRNLQELLKSIDDIIIFQKHPDMKQYSHKMKLCSCQIAKVLPSLCRVISSGTDPALKDICRYLICKLRWCLRELERILAGGGTATDTEPGGLFVRSIDSFLSSLKPREEDDEVEEEEEERRGLRHFIDDILCHALTIAKMAENEDYNEISAACRNVLTCIAGVESVADIDKEPLRREMILSSLVTLERKVNIAVLRLFLYVMSKFLPPLKSIIKKSPRSTGSRLPGDIDLELQSLDLYFERVQLIGNYAVACTECKRKKLKVQSSLASLEFLADYILPAAEAFYMDPTNLIRRRFLQFLTDESMDELKSLTALLDNIIDTPAFFQVLQEDLSHSIPNLKIKFSKDVYDPQESAEIVTKCYKLVSHLKTTDDPIVRDNKPLMDKTKEFLNVVKTHSDLSRERKSIDEKKFYENLDNIMKKVEELDELLTTTFMNRTTKMGNNFTINAVTSTPFSTVNKENGLDMSSLSCTPLTSKEDGQCLEPYLNKIFETPVVRPTLYNRTPYKSIRKCTPRNISFDISEVLESLQISCSPDEEVDLAGKTSLVGEDLEKNLFYTHPIPGDESAELNTVNSLKINLDLEFLENKIKQLTNQS